MKLFTPDYYVESYRTLDLERLKRHGIRVLVCDIDNTLAAHDEPLPDAQAIAFVRRVRDAGIQSSSSPTINGNAWSGLPARWTRSAIRLPASR